MTIRSRKFLLDKVKISAVAIAAALLLALRQQTARFSRHAHAARDQTTDVAKAMSRYAACG